jgi:hypothetical protein
MKMNNPLILKEDILEKAYKKYGDSHLIPPKNPNGNLLGDQLYSVIPMQHNYNSFCKECYNNIKFRKKWVVV